ncbi:ARM repeat-containing protein [Mycena floridula]|nr:ARM repeat-containing protein [Mycena floridula]
MSSPLPDDLLYLITSFIPSQTVEYRSKSYLTLSAFCQGVRSSVSVNEKATDALSKAFSPLIVPRLQETTENDLLVAISFLTALFQVDRESASSIFTQDGVLELVMDSIDLNPSPSLALHTAQLLGQACANKPCRAIISADTITWLESKSRQNQDVGLRAAAAIALVKLSKGNTTDNSGTSGLANPLPDSKDTELADMMRNMVLQGNQSSTADAVEGLAYLSVEPVIKEALANDSSFLQTLFALIPRRKAASLNDHNGTLLFGILVIVCNLCTYKPQMTEEQTQIEKLRKMAKAGNGPGAETASALDNDSMVKSRARKLVAAGVLDVFASAVPAVDTVGVRLNVGRALLGIVTDQFNRGKVLQSGGAKILTLIIRPSLPAKSSTAELDPAYLEPIQALAKLTITASPVQVFGPNVGATYDAIRPLSIMLQHSTSTMLQRFETIMALTNIASHSPETASRVADSEGLMNKVELLLLEDHTLIRRAAMELICNLIVGSGAVFERYGGGESASAVKTKVQILLAMADIEDLKTRIAASGALATVTAASAACHALWDLQLERHRFFSTLTLLIDPSEAPEDEDAETLETDPGLVHRGIVCAHNFASHMQKVIGGKEFVKEAQNSGLIKAINNIATNGQTPSEVKGPAVEILALFK